jgi:hypothetical protein
MASVALSLFALVGQTNSELAAGAARIQMAGNKEDGAKRKGGKRREKMKRKENGKETGRLMDVGHHRADRRCWALSVGELAACLTVAVDLSISKTKELLIINCLIQVINSES